MSADAPAWVVALVMLGVYVLGHRAGWEAARHEARRVARRAAARNAGALPLRYVPTPYRAPDAPPGGDR